MLVHSANFTSATRRGRTQVVTASSLTFAGKGDFSVFNFNSLPWSSSSVWWLKPVPTCPIYRHAPFSRTASVKAPKNGRLRRGAVKPAITTSCRRAVFTFSQSAVRLPEAYVSRDVRLMKVAEARRLPGPVFLKPPNRKTFPARVYAGGIELPEMPKRKLADRILDEILTLRRPRSLMVETDGLSREESPQSDVLNQSISPAAARRQLIVE